MVRLSPEVAGGGFFTRNIQSFLPQERKRVAMKDDTKGKGGAPMPDKKAGVSMQDDGGSEHLESLAHMVSERTGMSLEESRTLVRFAEGNEDSKNALFSFFLDGKSGKSRGSDMVTNGRSDGFRSGEDYVDSLSPSDGKDLGGLEIGSPRGSSETGGFNINLSDRGTPPGQVGVGESNLIPLVKALLSKIPEDDPMRLRLERATGGGIKLGQ